MTPRLWLPKVVYSHIILTATGSGLTDDFIQSLVFMVTFTTGAGDGETANIPVLIIDDDAVEAPETFSLSISVSPSPMASAGNTDTVTVTITDSDSELYTSQNVVKFQTIF